MGNTPERKQLAYRIGVMIRHVVAHNSFDRAELIGLLKETQRELEKENDDG